VYFCTTIYGNGLSDDRKISLHNSTKHKQLKSLSSGSIQPVCCWPGCGVSEGTFWDKFGMRPDAATALYAAAAAAWYTAPTWATAAWVNGSTTAGNRAATWLGCITLAVFSTVPDNGRDIPLFPCAWQHMHCCIYQITEQTSTHVYFASVC